MKKSVLFLVLALALLGTGAALAQSPQPAPQAPTLEQLRLAIFQPGLESGGPDLSGAFSPEVKPASHCTGDFCTKELCECAEQCQPCGVRYFHCLALICLCNQC